MDQVKTRDLAAEETWVLCLNTHAGSLETQSVVLITKTLLLGAIQESIQWVYVPIFHQHDAQI